MSTFDFDLNHYNYASEKLTPVPENDYALEIESNEIKVSTINPANSYTRLNFKISQGKYKGRKLMENLNLDHPDEQTKSIARGKLRTISKSCNKEEQLNTVKNLNILNRGNLGAHVEIQQVGNKFYNKITVYKKLEELNIQNEEQAEQDLSNSGILSKKPVFHDDDLPF